MHRIKFHSNLKDLGVQLGIKLGLARDIKKVADEALKTAELPCAKLLSTMKGPK